MLINNYFLSEEGDTYACGKDVGRGGGSKNEYTPILLSFPFKGKCTQIACGNTHVLILTGEINHVKSILAFY